MARHFDCGLSISVVEILFKLTANPPGKRRTRSACRNGDGQVSASHQGRHDKIPGFRRGDAIDKQPAPLGIGANALV